MCVCVCRPSRFTKTRTTEWCAFVINNHSLGRISSHIILAAYLQLYIPLPMAQTQQLMITRCPVMFSRCHICEVVHYFHFRQQQFAINLVASGWYLHLGWMPQQGGTGYKQLQVRLGYGILKVTRLSVSKCASRKLRIVVLKRYNYHLKIQA